MKASQKRHPRARLAVQWAAARVLAAKPSRPSEPSFDDAVLLHQSGQLDAAETIYRKILAAEPEHASALNLLGVIVHGKGQLQTAVELISKAIAINSSVASFHTNLGNVLLDFGRVEGATEHYRTALALQPEMVSAHNNLGYALLLQGSAHESLEHCDRSLALAPENPEVLTNKGSALLQLGHIDEAVELYEAALREKPGYSHALNNLGNARLDQGCFDLAMRHFDQALAVQPDCAESLLNKAVVQLVHGDFVAGWVNYEARQRMRGAAAHQRSFAQPQWRGEPLDGQRILLHAEQGLGDSIQFLRYVPLVEAAGGVVVLEVQRQLHRLAEGLPKLDALLAPGRGLPDFDWHCPLMSLPLAFGTGLDTIPAQVPYLTIPERERQHAASLGWPATGLRVGLVWSGSPRHRRDRYRSIALSLLEPLLKLPDLHFFSLQVGPSKAQLEDVPFTIIDLAPDPVNLADTAAKIANLDLILTVDTAVAHLAGALGKPVWVMVPFLPDWRWFLEREDSPWYPTMRLFRQPRPGDWDSVIERVHGALLDELRSEPSLRAKQQLESQSRVQAAASLVSDPVARPEPLPCKICGGSSLLFGLVDFHKSCMEAQGKRLNLSGIPVYYWRCAACRFVFSDSFDRWPEETFARRIYNADYPLVDPDFASLRPEGNARLIADAFSSSRSEISILDFGGGSGRLAEILRERGFSAVTYDPFSTHRELPQLRFNLITCFEVLEHAAQPAESLRRMHSLLEEEGLILFSTLLQPKNFDTIGLNWWYAAPRNGHVSLYSADSLIRLFAMVGLRVASYNENLHLAYRQVPGFARHLNILAG
jgi:tetratricopeptide (TPR) repeat protein